MVWADVRDLAEHLRTELLLGEVPDGRVIVTSGGFDPLHVGHVRLLNDSGWMSGAVVVVVNGDDWLVRKKGYAFMPLAERMEIVDSLEAVDHVVGWDDGTASVAGAIRLLRPSLLTKGGDRRCDADMDPAELEACSAVGCRILYGVGGVDKPQSSSLLVGRARSTA